MMRAWIIRHSARRFCNNMFMCAWEMVRALQPNFSKDLRMCLHARPGAGVIAMMHFRYSATSFIFCLCLLFFSLSFSSGQDVQIAEALENAYVSESVEPLVIKLSVEEVRLDAVVLDNKGSPITDLTAADFEIFQDGKRQEVLAAIYIDSRLDTVEQSSATEKKAGNVSQFSTPALKKEDVRRTIIFLIDDFVMSFENGYYTKMALRNFVEKQMQSGDLVAVIRTNYGNSALNMFYSNKRELLARINALPATNVVKAVDISDWALEKAPSMGQANALAAQRAFDRMALANLLSNISYSLRVAKSLPGRKIINTVTPGIKYNAADVPPALQILADEALRSDAVINFLGIDGLENFPEHGADASLSGRSYSSTLVNYSQLMRIWPLIPIPDLTGGVTIENRNFFLNGLGQETESIMRGYYLISYAPPPDTFENRGRNDNGYRRVKINVKRGGAKVYTRDGFFGRIKDETVAETPEEPLFAAIYSPFQSTDINVDIAAGYVRDAKAGYLVRSWIYIDPGDVTIVETEEGGRIDLEAVILTSDLNGKIQDSRRLEFTLSKTSVEWVRKHGLRFSMLLPVKKPGAYYVRISVQDRESGKVGSAYQFLEIPDVGKKGLALSNIFMITSADDLEWMRSNTTEEISKGVFFPMVQAEEVRSPALRTYKSGDILHTFVTLYNADPKAIARSEIETQTILYKDGRELQRGNPVTLTPDDVDGLDDSVPLLRRFTLGDDMPPGDYVLQLIAIDKKKSKKQEGFASQTLSFTVVENKTFDTGGNVRSE